MAYKTTIISKYGHFDYLVEYPKWVYIKITLEGKLALAVQHLIYCIYFKENVQKPQQITEF